MPRKQARKSNGVRHKNSANRKKKPARRSTLFKSSSWYQSAARAIGISGGPRL